MLYDIRTDKILEGLHMWTMDGFADTVEELGDFHDTIVIEEGTDEKHSYAVASANGGYSSLRMSAGYQHNHTTSRKEARATLKSSCRTGYQEINNVKVRTHLDTKAFESVNQRKLSGATHVVVKVEYGCDANFMFIRSINEKDKIIDMVYAEMKAALATIPVGGAGVDKEKTDSYFCNLYGDFSLNDKPTTFDQAMSARNKLFDKDTKRFPKARSARIVPITDIIDFYGFEHLDSDSIPKVCPIGVTLCSEVEELRKRLNRTTIDLRNLTKHKVCTRFECLHKQVNSFATESSSIEKGFNDYVSRSIPGIHSSQYKEDDFKEDDFKKEMQKWIERSDRVDVTVVEERILELSHYLEKIDQLKVKVVRKAELGVSSLHEAVVCFAFNDAANISTESNEQSTERRIFLEQQFQRFFEFAEQNLKSKTSFIVIEKNPSTPGPPGTVLYRSGKPEPFVLPSEVRTPAVSIDEDVAKFEWEEPKFGSENIQYYVVKITKGAYTTSVCRRTMNNTTTMTIPVSELPCNIFFDQEFVFCIKVVTTIGCSPWLEWTDPKIMELQQNRWNQIKLVLQNILYSPPKEPAVA
jgi:hypothetical protein